MNNMQDIQLPQKQPDACFECPLLGLSSKSMLSSKYSRNMYVCLGTMKTMQRRSIMARVSQRDAQHPLHRPCDDCWGTWMMTLPNRVLSINSIIYDECRIPYEKSSGSHDGNTSPVVSTITRHRIANEDTIKRIGGKMKEDYFTFKNDVDYINIYYFEFFSRLGMTDDVSCIIEALQSHKIKTVFFEKIWRDINEGRIPREKFISMRTVKYAKDYALSDPEKVKWKEVLSINYNIRMKYKEIGESYLKENKIYPFYPKHNHKAMEICGRALYVTPTSLEIDCGKFIEIYGDYLASIESETGRLHQQAVNTINQFFNGVEITPKELEKYFVLKDGIIMANPQSMSRECYSRLGWRNCK